MAPLRTRFLVRSSTTSAGWAPGGSGSALVSVAVALDAATCDAPREMTAAHGFPARAGSRLKPIRLNPMIRFYPDDSREWTGPYPPNEVANAHGSGTGGGRI